MFRIVNYGFVFILIYLFILEGMAPDHLRIVVGLALAILISGVAFLLNRITLDGLKTATLTGTYAFGFGGFAAALALVLFFVTSALLSDLPKSASPSLVQDPESVAKRRTGYQILANGFWLMFFLVFWFLTGVQSFLIAAIASVAASNSDTWATEIGQMRPGKTVDILSLKEVQPGTDGGVSLKGAVGALAGSFLISLTILIAPVQAAGGLVLVAGISGFAGSAVDSVLGAFFRKREHAFRIPSDYSGTVPGFLNNLTNWSATGIAGIIALIFTQIVVG